MNALRFLGIAIVGGALLLPAPYYAQQITGGHKTLDAAIVALLYLMGIAIVGSIMPTEHGQKNAKNRNLH